MWGADQHISLAGKGVFQKIAKSWSSTENTSTWSLWRSLLNERTRFVLLCVHRLCRLQGYFSNRKKTVTRSLYCIFMVAFNSPVTVEVLPSCCCICSSLKNLNTSKSCGNHSTKAVIVSHLLTRPRFKGPNHEGESSRSQSVYRKLFPHGPNRF